MKKQQGPLDETEKVFLPKSGTPGRRCSARGSPGRSGQKRLNDGERRSPKSLRLFDALELLVAEERVRFCIIEGGEAIPGFPSNAASNP